MSSAVYITFENEIQIEDFLKFAKKKNIVFSPNTVGQNAFYCGQVEITLDRDGSLPKINGRNDFDNAKPPAAFQSMTVCSFYGRNLDSITLVAQSIMNKWGSTFSCDEELLGGFQGYMDSYVRDKNEEDEEVEEPQEPSEKAISFKTSKGIKKSLS